MKVTSIELHPENSSEIVVLSFRDPRKQNSYNVKAIVGLDADEITPRYYKGSGGSSKFYALSLEQREIVIRVELNPNYSENETHASLRDDLYSLIATSRTGIIQVQFKNGLVVTAAVSGFVTKFEASHFEKTPEVQITVKCDDAMLRALEPIDVDVIGLDPALTIVNDTLSTAPHGFKFELSFTDVLASFKIEDNAYDSCIFEVVPVGGFLANDVLHFSSEQNDKYLYIVRGVDTIHLADVISLGSVWPIMFPKENSFSLENPTVLTWDSILYYPTYWGV